MRREVTLGPRPKKDWRAAERRRRSGKLREKRNTWETNQTGELKRWDGELTIVKACEGRRDDKGEGGKEKDMGE